MENASNGDKILWNSSLKRRDEENKDKVLNENIHHLHGKIIEAEDKEYRIFIPKNFRDFIYVENISKTSISCPSVKFFERCSAGEVYIVALEDENGICATIVFEGGALIDAYYNLGYKFENKEVLSRLASYL